MSDATPAGGGSEPAVCPLQKRREPPESSAYDTLVTIQFEGNDDTAATNVYQVHKGLVSHFSDYFRGAFSSSFQEGKTGVVTLPRDDLIGFQVFFRWIYKSRLLEPRDTNNNIINAMSPSHPLVHAYIFAEARGVPGLKNEIIDWMIDRNTQKRKIPTSYFNNFWKELPETDGLLNLFVDWLVRKSLAEEFYDDEKGRKYPHDLLMKILQNVGVKGRRPQIVEHGYWMKRKCQFHDHRDMSAQADKVDELLSTERKG